MTTLKVGDKAPEFSVLDETGKTRTLKDYLGKKLVLFFYPKASTPTCTVEACNLSDNYSLLKEKGFEVLGVSADTQKRQQNFKAKYKFPYPLLADTQKKVINAYGVWGPKKFMGMNIVSVHRTTFIIDEKGIIERIITNVVSGKHAQQILEEMEV